MNTNAHLDDDALSALVDDDPGAGRAHVDLCPTCASRLAAFTAARTLMRASADEPLDELTRRRLVQHAMAVAITPTARSSRSLSGSRWAAPVAIAAAVAGLIGGLGLITRGTPAHDKTTSAALPATDVRDLGQLGDVSNPATLRALLSRSRGQQTSGAAAGEATPNGAGAPAADQVAPYTAVTGRVAATDASQVQVCASELQRKGNPGRLSLRGVGTYQGRDALVIAFEQGSGGRLIAFVLEPSTCEVLHSQVL